MRILIATPLYPPAVGGPSKYAAALKEALSAQGARVDVVAYGRVERMLPVGLRHVWYGFRLLPAALGADTVLALDTWSVGLPAFLVARLCRARFLVRIGGDFLWEAYVERTRDLVTLSEFYERSRPLTLKERAIKKGTALLVRHADALVFNTEWQLNIWRKPYAIPTRRAHVVENMYPPVRATAPKGKVFVAAGRDIALKNMATLHAAFKAVQARHPEISLDTQTLAPEAHARRIADCYAVVVPSVSEVNPNTAIEALASGKPFIAPADSGIVAKAGGVGVFIDTMDAAALERAIEGLLDPQSYQETQARAREFTYVHSWDDIAKEIAVIARAI